MEGIDQAFRKVLEADGVIFTFNDYFSRYYYFWFLANEYLLSERIA